MQAQWCIFLVCSDCAKSKGPEYFPSLLSSDISVSAMFVFVYVHELSHVVCVWLWMRMWVSVCASVCPCGRVCSFMCACPPGSTGVLSGNTKASSSSVWSWLNSELEPAASSHISSATWEKNKKNKKGSAPLIFCSVPAGRHHVDLAMLAPSPWNQATALASAPLTLTDT